MIEKAYGNSTTPPFKGGLTAKTGKPKTTGISSTKNIKSVTSDSNAVKPKIIAKVSTIKPAITATAANAKIAKPVPNFNRNKSTMDSRSIKQVIF